jgi:hypothetical protein
LITYRIQQPGRPLRHARIILHKLRHLASRSPAGVDIAVVSKRLRHSSIEITNDTYGHMIGTIGRHNPRSAGVGRTMHHANRSTLVAGDPVPASRRFSLTTFSGAHVSLGA